jgi:exodeoxyribonuclease-3
VLNRYKVSRKGSQMKFISWNVNGLRASIKKGFYDVFDAFAADIFAIQESKLQAGQVDLQIPSSYHQVWSYAERKGYSGTAVFSLEKPLRTLHELEFTPADGIVLGTSDTDVLNREGRLCALEFERFWFVNCYTPNAQDGLARIALRLSWGSAFTRFVANLAAGRLPQTAQAAQTAQAEQTNQTKKAAPAATATPVAQAAQAAQTAKTAKAAKTPQAAQTKKAAQTTQTDQTQQTNPATLPEQPTLLTTPKPVIICGDLNVAHNEIDLKNPGPNRGNAGFSDEERDDFSALLAAGFTDSFRHLYPDLKDAYSWWSYRGNARANNTGWRIDYFLVSDVLAQSGAISQADIYPEVTGSDHCPIGLELQLP